MGTHYLIKDSFNDQNARAIRVFYKSEIHSVEDKINFLRDLLVGEIFAVLKFSKTGWMFRTFGRLFHTPTERLARIGATADQIVAESGFPAACAWMQSHWVNPPVVRGNQLIPARGPLLIVANHTGTFDSLVLGSAIQRPDLRIITSDISFLKNLPHAARNLIFLSRLVNDRSAALREGMRHLRGGGALLIFGTGLIDPDPVETGSAAEAIEHWSPSIDIFMQSVPDNQLVLAITSGLLDRKWARHPVTWLEQLPWKKRRLAEFAQVIYQLFNPGRFYLSPCVNFSSPTNLLRLRKESGADTILPAVIERGKALLSDHQRWIWEMEISTAVKQPG